MAGDPRALLQKVGIAPPTSPHHLVSFPCHRIEEYGYRGVKFVNEEWADMQHRQIKLCRLPLEASASLAVERRSTWYVIPKLFLFCCSFAQT